MFAPTKIEFLEPVKRARSGSINETPLPQKCTHWMMQTRDNVYPRLFPGKNPHRMKNEIRDLDRASKGKI